MVSVSELSKRFYGAEVKGYPTGSYLSQQLTIPRRRSILTMTPALTFPDEQMIVRNRKAIENGTYFPNLLLGILPTDKFGRRYHHLTRITNARFA